MNPVAVVTGASSGIGRAAALRLAAAGYHIGFTFNGGREAASALSAEIRSLGGRAVARQLNLADPAGAAAVVDELVNELGNLHAFVNNAGINHRHDFLTMPIEQWNEVLAVNLTGAFACAQRAAQRMVASGTRGRIVNVTSVLDREILDGGAAYCTSKAGLRQLTRVMALVLAP